MKHAWMQVDRAGSPARKVLVVDDDASWRALVVDSLEELGYQAVEAADGEAALRALERGDCSVMLLDLRMPGLSGEEVLARLPAHDGPRVVLLTAADMDQVQQALGRRPHYYLSKDAGRDALALLLQSLEA
jgi:CheY-like chemotaxis protein